ncbi:hypothetical protein KAS08_01340 [Candidatus Pacearchaeota archaeon]|nr:hypothetical protein [Candidatus Pacearchaeota archaeon]
MKTSQIGDFTVGKFKTVVLATEEVKKKFKSKKVSFTILMPVPWAFLDVELFDVIDENGDGKPDEKFGTEFKIIYVLEKQNAMEFEQDALILNKITIGGIRLKYVALKL